MCPTVRSARYRVYYTLVQPASWGILIIYLRVGRGISVVLRVRFVQQGILRERSLSLYPYLHSHSSLLSTPLPPHPVGNQSH